MTLSGSPIASKGAHGWTPEAPLPAILSSGRSRIFGRLLANGVLQVAATLCIAFAVHLFDPSQHELAILVAALAVASVVVVLLRLVELVDAERLGQHYVTEVRLALFDGLADGPKRMSRGVSTTRLMNDLASLKTWVGFGLGRSYAAWLSLGGCVVAAALIDPLLALVVFVPIALAGVASTMLYRRLRSCMVDVCHRRGRLAARLGRVLLSLEQLGRTRLFRRSRRRVDKAGRGLAIALERRIWMFGLLRAFPEAALPTIVLLTVATGLATQGAAGLGLVLIAGLMVDPLRNAVRALEYRVAFQTAHRRIGPAIAPGFSADRSGPPTPTGSGTGAPAGTLEVLDGDRSANRRIWTLRDGVLSVDPDQPILKTSLRRNIDLAVNDECPEKLRRIADICGLTPRHGFAVGLDTPIDGGAPFLTREAAGRIRFARALASGAPLIFVDDLSLVSHRLGASALVRAAELLNVTIVVNIGDAPWPAGNFAVARGP